MKSKPSHDSEKKWVNMFSPGTLSMVYTGNTFSCFWARLKLAGKTFT